MDTLCKLLADKIWNPWSHGAIRHQLNDCEPKGVNVEIPYKIASVGGFQLLP